MNTIAGMLLILSLFDLPDGPGRAETERICKQCHELERSVSKRQGRDGWRETINKMVTLGLKANEKDLQSVLEYLAKNYPGEELPKVNVNKATSIELESGLTLRRSQAAAVIQYRAKNGDFKSIEDLKKVPGLDAEHIDARKDRITF
jgi:competence protein ComEA